MRAESDLLRANDGEDDDVYSNGADEDALYTRVIRHDRGLPVLDDGSLHVITTCCFNLRGGGRDHLSYRHGQQIVHMISEALTFPSW